MRVFVVLFLIPLFAVNAAVAQRLSLDKRAVSETGYFFIHGGCKVLIPVAVSLYSSVDSADISAVRVVERKKILPPPPVHVPFLSVHGNVLYDYYYQSNIDTPYTEKDIYQHTVQTNLSITVKDRYPLRFSFSTQAGNSSLFRNLTGVRLYYTNRDFKQQLLSKAKGWSAAKLKQQHELDTLADYLQSIEDKINSLKSFTTTPSFAQKLVEAKEMALLAQRDSLSAKVPGSNKGDSLYRSLLAAADKYKSEVDSLQRLATKARQKYNLLAGKVTRQKTNLMDVLQHSRNNKELSDELERMNLPDSVLPKGFRTMLAVRSFGIGRTMADYSELTARNISITGVQVEYNPSYYLAVASGVVDYRFRNFIVKENRAPQYITLVRGGVGMKEDNHVFLTYYTGKKQLYGMNAVGINQEAADSRLMGVALEAQWKLGKNTYLVGEVAKSSLPFNTRKEHGSSNLGSMLNFSGHTNEAYTATFNTLINRTGTRFSSMYKMMGSDFQSFSLYTTGSRQIAWSLNAEQPFFHRKLFVIGAIQKNNFATFYQPSNYESNTVFKSIQVSVRIPHWPIVNLGYQPSSQLVKVNNDRFMEQLFYMLTGTATHTYNYRGTMMNTMVTYSRFYNKQTDTAFVYFNSRNLMAGQTVFLKKFTLAAQASAAITEEYSLYGLGGDVTCKALSWLEAGGSAKYNHQTLYNLKQWGYGGHIRLMIPKVGEILVQGEKTYIPGSGRQLVSNNTGRLTYTKIF